MRLHYDMPRRAGRETIGLALSPALMPVLRYGALCFSATIEDWVWYFQEIKVEKNEGGTTQKKGNEK